MIVSTCFVFFCFLFPRKYDKFGINLNILTSVIQCHVLYFQNYICSWSKISTCTTVFQRRECIVQDLIYFCFVKISFIFLLSAGSDVNIYQKSSLSFVNTYRWRFLPAYTKQKRKGGRGEIGVYQAVKMSTFGRPFLSRLCTVQIYSEFCGKDKAF